MVSDSVTWYQINLQTLNAFSTNLVRQLRRGHKTEMDRHQSRVFCDPKIALQCNIDSDSNYALRNHRLQTLAKENERCIPAMAVCKCMGMKTHAKYGSENNSLLKLPHR